MEEEFKKEYKTLQDKYLKQLNETCKLKGIIKDYEIKFLKQEQEHKKQMDLLRVMYKGDK